MVVSFISWGNRTGLRCVRSTVYSRWPVMPYIDGIWVHDMQRNLCDVLLVLLFVPVYMIIDSASATTICEFISISIGFVKHEGHSSVRVSVMYRGSTRSQLLHLP